MTDDFRLSTSFLTHRKTKRLRRRLGADGVLGLIALWAWAARERWTGDLTGLTDEDIEESADWQGEPGALVAALTAPGSTFITGEPGARKLHEWAEHNPYAATKGARIAKGKRAAEERWKRHREQQMARQADLDLDATSMDSDATSIEIDASSNALGQCPPAPTYPSTTNIIASGKIYERGTQFARAAMEVAKALGGMGVECGSRDEHLLAALAEGFSPQQIIDLASSRKGRGKPVAYLLSTLRGKRNDVAQSTPVIEVRPKQDPNGPEIAKLEAAIYDARHLCDVTGTITPEERDLRIRAAKARLLELSKAGAGVSACETSGLEDRDGNQREGHRIHTTGGL